jgi:hypothetical protein
MPNPSNLIRVIPAEGLERLEPGTITRLRISHRFSPYPGQQSFFPRARPIVH